MGVRAEIGVVAYGGLLGAAFAMLLYAKWDRRCGPQWWSYAGAFVPSVFLATVIAIVRLGIVNWRDEPRYLLGLTAGQWTAAAILVLCAPALRGRTRTHDGEREAIATA